MPLRNLYPSVQEILSIWSSNIPISDCFEVFVSSSQLIRYKQHEFYNQWKNVIITIEIMDKIIGVIGNSVVELDEKRYFVLRRNAIELLCQILQNYKRNLDNDNYSAIQRSISQNKNTLLEALLMFAYVDSALYSSVYDIFNVIIPMLDRGIEDLLESGLKTVRNLDSVIRRMNYYKCISFCLTHLSDDFSVAQNCFQYLIELSSFVEINTQKSFPIENFVILFQKILNLWFDSKLMQSTILFLSVVLKQETYPESKQFWTNFIPSVLIQLLDDKVKRIDESSRKSIITMLTLLASNSSIRPHIQAKLTRLKLLDYLMDDLPGNNDESKSNEFRGLFGLSTNHITFSNTYENSSDAQLTRLECDTELYSVLYWSDNDSPIYEHKRSRRSLHLDIDDVSDEYIKAVVLKARAIIELACHSDRREFVMRTNVWHQLSNLFSFLSKYVNLSYISAIQPDLFIISDLITTEIINSFQSCTDENSSSDIFIHGASSAYYMIAILNVLCGFLPLCWVLRRIYVQSDLFSDSLLVNSESVVVLTKDPDKTSSTHPSSDKANESVPSSSKSDLFSKNQTSRRRHSMDIQSPIQQKIHDQFLEYDLKQISSTSWFAEDIGFLFNLNVENLMHDENALTSFIWKMLYMLICIRYIGLWRLIISDSQTDSAHGLDLAMVVKKIINLLAAIYPDGYYPLRSQTDNAELNTVGRKQSTFVLLCQDVLVMLLQYNSPESPINSPANHSSSADHNTTYDLPAISLSQETSNSCYDFCINSLTQIFQHNRLSLQSHRGSTTTSGDSVEIITHSISTLIALALQPKEFNIRREIIRNFGHISVVMNYLDPFQPSVPKLILLNTCKDRISKFPESSEEKLFHLLLGGLKSRDKNLQLLVCDMIANFSEVHPGLIFRTISRPEIEDQLLNMLSSHQRIVSSSNRLSLEIVENLYMAQLYTIFRACSACVKDINPRPAWIYLPGNQYYNWRKYSFGLKSRHLLHSSVISLSLQKLDSASNDGYISPLIVAAFSEMLSFMTSLMYNCADGVLSSVASGLSCPSVDSLDSQSLFLLRSTEEGAKLLNNIANSGCTPSDLKDELVVQVLPLLPRPLDLVTLRESNPWKNHQQHLDSNSFPFPKSYQNENRNSNESSSPLLSSISKFKDSNPTPNRTLSATSSISPLVSSQSSSNTINVQRSKSFHLPPAMKLGSVFHRGSTNSPTKLPENSRLRAVYPDLEYEGVNTTSISLEATLEMSSSSNAALNQALLLLSSKTLDALFAFLCLDEMFPMSTYLRNISIFRDVPIVASTSSLMIRYRTDDFILRRGLGILKAFAFNQIEVSSLSVHCPVALLAAYKLLGHQQSEIQITCCKIISVIASFDENCRENILRFNIYNEILALILRNSDHVDAIVACCIAISSLAQSMRNVYMLTMGGRCQIHEHLLVILKKHPAEKKVQIEALKALISLTDYSQDVLSKIVGHHDSRVSHDDKTHDVNISILKKTNKYLNELMRNDELQPEYSKEEIAILLNSAITTQQSDKCSIS